jgi:DNA-binding protein H-NS
VTKSVQIIPYWFANQERDPMARTRALENMSVAELTELRVRVDRLLVSRKNEARVKLREKMASLAKAEGLSLQEVLGAKGRRGKGSVAIKYRDPSNPANTWTGRGRMPRWMVSATKRGKAKKEDFLI